jgi:hypothetical protein
MSYVSEPDYIHDNVSSLQTSFTSYKEAPVLRLSMSFMQVLQEKWRRFCFCAVGLFPQYHRKLMTPPVAEQFNGDNINNTDYLIYQDAAPQ